MAVRILSGDARQELKRLADESIHCVVTSPPYFGLRDYGTAAWHGGDPECDHSVGGQVQDNKAPGAIRSGVRPGVDASYCLICGAVRIDSQIGLEPTPDAYVAELVSVFREVRRVLRKDGTLWLNLGDSYAAVNRGENARPRTETLNGIQAGNPHSDIRTRREVIRGQKDAGLKPKDLIGIPWRVAFALQADGWYLRQDIIWSKPNPMPESVTDRCTKAHEYLFLLAKSARYYFNAEAIAEEANPENYRANPSVREIPPGQSAQGKMDVRRGEVRCESRNRRSVWTIATQPFSEAHFATFPPALIEPCILAGCPKGGTVLDPFGGAGTTGLVADRLGRDAVLIELNPEYAEMAKRRIHDDAPLFAEVEL